MSEETEELNREIKELKDNQSAMIDQLKRTTDNTNRLIDIISQIVGVIKSCDCIKEKM